YHGCPLEGGEFRSVLPSEHRATAGQETDRDADDERRQKQDLPVESEIGGREVEPPVDQRRQGVDADQRKRAEQQDEASGHRKKRLVHFAQPRFRCADLGGIGHAFLPESSLAYARHSAAPLSFGFSPDFAPKLVSKKRSQLPPITAETSARRMPVARRPLAMRPKSRLSANHSGIAGKPGADALPSPYSFSLVHRPTRIHSTMLSGWSWQCSVPIPTRSIPIRSAVRAIISQKSSRLQALPPFR